MKVLLVACSPGGGITTFFGYVYGHKAFEDVEGVLAAPGEAVAQYVGKYVKSATLRTLDLPKKPIKVIATLRDLVRSEKPDLIHSHGFRAGLLLEIARTGLPVPHLMTAHDVFLGVQFRGVRGKAQWLALNTVYRRVDKVHAVSEDCGENFRAFMPLVQRSKVQSILHGIDTERFSSAEPIPIRQTVGLPDDAVVVGFFGRFMGQKGFRTLVDAIATLKSSGRLPDDFHVVTFGWGGFIREDYAYVERRGLSDRFHQHPQTEQPETAIKAVDVVAMPSRWEACGLLGMEVLAAGVPLVGTNCVGLREVLDGSPAKVMSPGDAEALATAILELVPPNSKQPFEAYKEEAARRFDIDRAASALRAVYEEMV